MAKKEIKCFAFFDLETTGLPEYNFNKANVTEFSMTAITSQDLSAGSPGKPRVQHKLTLCFNPAMLVSLTASDISGLDNYLLENENKFDKNAGSLILAFIKHLQQPVCLVAHNGTNFDFPILRKALKKIEMELPGDILCLDSIPTIAKIEKNLELIEKYNKTEETELSNNKNNVNSSNADIPLEQDEKFHKLLYEEHASIVKDESAGKINPNVVNETTPKKLTKFINYSQASSAINRDDDNTTPPLVGEKSSYVIKSKRALFPQTPTKSTRNIHRRSYRLADVYERRAKRPMKNAHTAEADVEALVITALSFNRDFVEYAEHNAILFSDIPLK